MRFAYLIEEEVASVTELDKMVQHAVRRMQNKKRAAHPDLEADYQVNTKMIRAGLLKHTQEQRRTNKPAKRKIVSPAKSPAPKRQAKTVKAQPDKPLERVKNFAYKHQSKTADQDTGTDEDDGEEEEKDPPMPEVVRGDLVGLSDDEDLEAGSSETDADAQD